MINSNAVFLMASYLHLFVIYRVSDIFSFFSGFNMDKLEFIHESDWSRGSILWKYMDIYSFISLISHSRLKFTRLDSFEDGFEGRMPMENQVTLSLNFAAQQYYTRSANEVQELENRLEDSRSRTWVSSWKISNEECSMMWRVYGSRQNGIAIRTTVDRLLSSIETDRHCFAGTVRYLDYFNDGVDESNDANFSFHKQKGYASESEFRVAFFDGAESASEVPDLIDVDISMLIEKVVVSPWSDEWQKVALRRVLGKFGHNENIIKSSRIMGIN